MGNYSFEDSVANDLRAGAREAAEADLIESVESGIYSEQALYTAERLTPDQLIEIAEEGLRPQHYADEGLASPYEVSHIESLASSPQVGGEVTNVVVTDPLDHFYGQHHGDYSVNPSEYGNANFETNPEADQAFGEGSHLDIVSEEVFFAAEEFQGSSALDRAGSRLLETSGFNTGGLADAPGSEDYPPNQDDQ